MQHDPVWLIPTTIQVLGTFVAWNGRGAAPARAAEGQKLAQVAADSNGKVDSKIAQERAARRRQNEPIQLRRRDNSIVNEQTPPPGTASMQQNPPSQ